MTPMSLYLNLALLRTMVKIYQMSKPSTMPINYYPT
jgi:hypothetical protein